MRTTLDLPDPLFRELKTRAASQGVKMKDLLTVFIENGLRGEKLAIIRSSVRSPLPIARRATGNVIPAFKNGEIAEILDLEDADVQN